MFFMSKKKKLKKLAKENIKITSSGKVIISKDQKIDLKPFVNNSVATAIVSRLDGIISREDVVVDNIDRIDMNIDMVSSFKEIELLSRAMEETPQKPTLVIVGNKKNSLSMFDYLNTGTLGTVLRTSTLSSIYKQLKDDWTFLCQDDNTKFTNVFYVENVMSFVDEETTNFRKRPIIFNLLLVLVPSKNKMIDADEEEISDDTAIRRIVNDVSEAIIKTGTKYVVIDPFEYKMMEKNPYIAVQEWVRAISEQNFKNNVKSVSFAVEDESLFVSLTAEIKKQIGFL